MLIGIHYYTMKLFSYCCPIPLSGEAGEDGEEEGDEDEDEEDAACIVNVCMYVCVYIYIWRILLHADTLVSSAATTEITCA